jgi:hypothetical protein
MTIRQYSFALTALTILVSMSVPARSGIVYVNGACVGVHDGSSWSTACQTVSAGLAAAVSGDEVWVATGIYTGQISLKPGVGVYGGFLGGEELRDERNPSVNITTLDGANTVIVVIVPPGCASDTVIDGFTICHGRATTIAAKNGGGVYCSSSPTISGNVIADNTATNYGGGMYFVSSSATVTRNIIQRNATASSGRGGGVYCDSGSSITLSGNTIEENSASMGGGIYCNSTSATIANNSIRKNNTSIAALGQGGGIFCQASPLIANNTICENTAYAGGGIYCSLIAAPTIANNIVAFNSSGILKNALQTPQVLSNCVYGNTSYEYSGWETPAGPDGNISVDPRLVDWANGDIHIRIDSPCRNAGDNAQVQPGWMDIDNQNRVQESSVDIGADEYPELQAATSSIVQARQADNGSVVDISDALVSAAFLDFFYIEADDRLCGIRVEQSGFAATVGSRVNVHGVMRTNTDGERYIEVTTP